MYLSVYVALGVYVHAHVPLSVDAQVQALLTGPDTCMANLLVHVCGHAVQALLTGPDACMADLLVHVCAPALLESSKALTCTGTLHEHRTRACRRDLEQTSTKCITTVTCRLLHLHLLRSFHVNLHCGPQVDETQDNRRAKKLRRDSQSVLEGIYAKTAHVLLMLTNRVAGPGRQQGHRHNGRCSRPHRAPAPLG